MYTTTQCTHSTSCTPPPNLHPLHPKKQQHTGTATVYCEWCPLGQVLDAQLLQAAAFLINTPDFRDTALELLRQVGERKQAQEDPGVYKAAMQATGIALMSAAGVALSAEHVGELDVDGGMDEYGRRLCDTMALFGIAHFRDGIQMPESRITFLQQVCGVVWCGVVWCGVWVVCECGCLWPLA